MFWKQLDPIEILPLKSVRKSEYFPLVGPTTLAYPEK